MTRTSRSHFAIGRPGIGMLAIGVMGQRLMLPTIVPNQTRDRTVRRLQHNYF